MVSVNKNVSLYWADDAPSQSVKSVVEKWQQMCAGWNVSLYSRTTAHAFLKSHFGQDISDAFLSCAIPAMQSDFFRVFWAISEGGVYSDITFVPKAEPLFFAVERSLTVPTWNHGRIVNGIFYATKGSSALQRLADVILETVTQKDQDNVWLATGPGAWINTLGQEETADMAIVSNDYLFDNYIRHSGYASTRGTDAHWSILQKNNDIYYR